MAARWRVESFIFYFGSSLTYDCAMWNFWISFSISNFDSDILRLDHTSCETGAS